MKNFLCFCTLLIWFTGGLYAQPFTLDDKIKPKRLDLKNVPDKKGAKSTGVMGTINDEPHYFFVKGHGMLQPLDIILESDESADLNLEIYYATWNNPEKKCNTSSGKGLCQVKFMVYGEFGIKVTTNTPGTDYALTIYGSPEWLPDLESPFVLTKNADVSKPGDALATGGNNTLFIGIFIALLIIIVLLAVVLLKKNRNKSAATVILLCSISMVISEKINAQNNPSGNQRGNNSGTGSPDSYEVFIIPPAPDRDMSKEDYKKWNDRTKKTAEAVKKIQDGIDAYNAYQSLGDCMRITTPPSAPRVPSFCATPVVAFESEGIIEYRMENNEECANCFTESRLAFNNARLDLEKLKVIYNCTKKMSNSAIAAGDNMASIHGVTGIVWQGLRYEIQKSVSDLEKAYDSKYLELIQKLNSTMHEMNACEAQFGEPDWYDRHGFMYYEFMKEAYKRKD
ncbi:MAG: hypothetical protein ACFCUU_08455 [Cyclobacteriaceae bacterium]